MNCLAHSNITAFSVTNRRFIFNKYTMRDSKPARKKLHFMVSDLDLRSVLTIQPFPKILPEHAGDYEYIAYRVGIRAPLRHGC